MCVVLYSFVMFFVCGNCLYVVINDNNNNNNNNNNNGCTANERFPSWSRVPAARIQDLRALPTSKLNLNRLSYFVVKNVFDYHVFFIRSLVAFYYWRSGRIAKQERRERCQAKRKSCLGPSTEDASAGIRGYHSREKNFWHRMRKILQYSAFSVRNVSLIHARS